MKNIKRVGIGVIVFSIISSGVFDTGQLNASVYVNCYDNLSPESSFATGKSEFIFQENASLKYAVQLISQLLVDYNIHPSADALAAILKRHINDDTIFEPKRLDRGYILPFRAESGRTEALKVVIKNNVHGDLSLDDIIVTHDTEFDKPLSSVFSIGAQKNLVMSITSPAGNDFDYSVRSLKDIVASELEKNGFTEKDIVRQVVFLDVDANLDDAAQAQENLQYRSKFISEFQNLYGKNNLPATSFIAQPPLGGSKIAIEITAIKNNNESAEKIKVNRVNENLTIVEDGDIRHAYICGIEPQKEILDPFKQLENIYAQISVLLQTNGFTFEDVVRFWNYVYDIVGENKVTKGQNYAILNEVRKIVFDTWGTDGGPIIFGKKLSFKTDSSKSIPPAATGIGTSFGNFSIECEAVSTTRKDITFRPITNPEQTDPYKYEQDYLADGSKKEKPKEKAEPRFSRGTELTIGKGKMIFVSGTASVKGSIVMHEGDVEKQTETTLDNIRLVLKEAGADFSNVPQIRVYVKNTEDYEKVKKIVERDIPGIPAVFVHADVCRPGWLVEIEALAFISDENLTDGLPDAEVAQDLYDDIINVSDIVQNSVDDSIIPDSNNKIILAFEDEWMNNKGYGRQALINAVMDLSEDKGGIKNFIIVRASKDNLAEAVKKMSEEASINYANIVVFGSDTLLKEDTASKFTDASGNMAFLAGVNQDALDDITNDTYLCFLEMLTAALRIAFIDKDLDYFQASGVRGEKIAARRWSFIPNAIEMSADALSNTHKLQTDFLRNV
ncbi:MAG: hypothetical protein HQL29_00210 [Candidatus Omnitrophica bacterium]|nr:hypothetical protein [Candidatus Omnitrophota bacterium]